MLGQWLGSTGSGTGASLTVGPCGLDLLIRQLVKVSGLISCTYDSTAGKNVIGLA